ncbi:MAG TPA: hypothetical protein VJT68_10065 [Thermoleophilaceae bacterium]|nr:hypothetical protein [Thermoleophilaceae bacterium]
MTKRIGVIALALLAAVFVAAGCGGDDSSEQKPPPPAREQDFPKVEGQTLRQLLAKLGSGPVLAPSGAEFRTGEQRVGFALFRRDRSQITNASVALYVAPVGGGPAEGPYLARYEDLSVRPQFQSRQTATDPDAAKSIYTAKIPFDKPGRYEMLGIAKQGKKLAAATLPQPGIVVKKAADDPIPAVGTAPPRIHTPTITEVGGNAAAIDTRLPPSSMHDVDFANVLGKKPVVLVFATPQLCQSRVCGPVVDLAEQVKANASNSDVAFIHMEVFRDNRIDKGIRPQMAAFHLQTEPWLFTFNKEGKVAERLEGAFSERELDDAIAKAKTG